MKIGLLFTLLFFLSANLWAADSIGGGNKCDIADEVKAASDSIDGNLSPEGEVPSQVTLTTSQKANPPATVPASVSTARAEAVEQVSQTQFREQFSKIPSAIRPSVPVGKVRGQEVGNHEAANREFISLAEREIIAKNPSVVYVDVENSLLKRMNDYMFQDKPFVDSLNNFYFKNYYEKIQENPFLRERLKGSYQDFKNLRLRLETKNPAEKTRIEQELEAIQAEVRKSMALQLEKMNVKKMMEACKKCRESDFDPNNWFLTGVGEDYIRANVAARKARGLKGKKSGVGVQTFAKYEDEVFADLNSLEDLRKIMSQNPKYLALGILERPIGNGSEVLSRDMLEILRKTDPENVEGLIDRVARTFNGYKMSPDEVKVMRDYFERLDGLSTPFLTRVRTEHDLSKAKGLMFSVDVKGAGPDNIYELAKAAAASVNAGPLSVAEKVGQFFKAADQGTVRVTNQMVIGKRMVNDRTQALTGKEVNYSGDDGFADLGSAPMYKVKQLVQKIAEQSPNKFRMTFVDTNYMNTVAGSFKPIPIPSDLRSKAVVAAEDFEKKLFEALMGQKGFDRHSIKQLTVGIHYTPSQEGVGAGLYQIILGQSISPEKEAILRSTVAKILDPKKGQIFGGKIDQPPYPDPSLKSP